MRRLVAFLALALLAPGCATAKVDWNSRVGNYTFDDAVTEMGVPDRQATLSDGSVVGEWLMRRGGSYGSWYYSPGFRFHTYDINEFPDSYVRLTFGPDKQLVRAAKFAR